MTETELPDFAGKLVVFYFAGAAASSWGESGVVLEFVEFRRIGDKLFIVGRMPEKVGVEWVWNLRSGIAWDAVAHYLVFDSREEYERRIANAQPGFLKRLVRGGAG